VTYRHLDLSYNELRSFEDLSPCAGELIDLYLPRNKIATMQDTLRGMKKLKMLEMGSNRLKVTSPGADIGSLADV
jgi:Leucine-rich repeat (LRR) protein